MTKTTILTWGYYGWGVEIAERVVMVKPMNLREAWEPMTRRRGRRFSKAKAIQNTLVALLTVRVRVEKVRVRAEMVRVHGEMVRVWVEQARVHGEAVRVHGERARVLDDRRGGR
jgi:hypothetical protein